MRITYRTLQGLIGYMNQEQLNSDVTVEMSGELFAASLQLMGQKPVISAERLVEVGERRNDIDQLAYDLGLKTGDVIGP